MGPDRPCFFMTISVEAVPGWEHFDHEADIGLRAMAETRAEVFEQAAVAMTAAVTDPNQIRPEEAVEISCEAPTNEILLVDWLNALIYEMAVRKMLFRKFKVELDGTLLHGVAFGETVDVQRHSPAVEIKGATYTALEFGRGNNDLWQAQCVIDV